MKYSGVERTIAILLFCVSLFVITTNTYGQDSLVNKLDSLKNSVYTLLYPDPVESFNTSQRLIWLADSLGLTEERIRYRLLQSNVYNFISDQENRLRCIEDAHALSLEGGDSLLIATTLNYLANTFDKTESFDLKKEYHQKALGVALRNGFDEFVCGMLNNLAITEKRLGNKQQGIEYFKEAIVFFKEKDLENMEFFATLHGNIGTTYTELSQFDSAHYYLSRSRKIGLQLASEHRMVSSYLDFMELYEKMNLLDSSLYCTNMAIAICNKLQADHDWVRLYKNLSVVNEKKGNHQQALSYHKKWIEEKQRVDNIQSVKKMALSHAKVRVNKLLRLQEKKIQQVEALSERSGMIAIFMSIILLMTVVGIVLLRGKNKKLTFMLEERKVLVQEIHHRVKNNFQFISGIIHMQSKKVSDPTVKQALQECRNRVLSMATVHKDMYFADPLQETPLDEYINKLLPTVLGNYNDPALKKIKTSLSFSGNMTVSQEVLIPIGIITNELITNSVKHADTGGHPLELTLKIKKSETGKFHYTYADNGILCESPREGGFGLELIRIMTAQLEGEFTHLTSNQLEITFYA